MKNTSIRHRLWLSFGAMFCLLCVVSGLFVISIGNISRKSATIYEQAFPAASTSWRLQMAVHELMDLIDAAALASRADILNDIPSAEIKLNGLLDQIQTLERNQHIQSGQYEAVIIRYRDAKKIGHAWVEATLNEDWEQEPVLGQRFHRTRDELQRLIDEIRQEGTHVLTDSMSNITATSKQVYFQTFVIWIIGSVMFVVLSVITSKAIINPITELLVVIQNLRKQDHDYSKRVDLRSSDEIGHLAQEFNGMLDEKEGYQLTLKKYTEQLESQVEERTHQLKKEKEAHQESEEYLQTIFNSTRAGILVIDPETHTIVDANPFALDLMGKTLNDVQGRDCHQFVCPAERGQCPITDLGIKIDGSERLLNVTGNQQIDILKTVVPFNRKGKQMLIESFIDIAALKSAQCELNLALTQMEHQVEKRTWELAETNQLLRTEIEERKHAEIENLRLQEQLKTAEKMEAIGKLAGSVAHDLNNVLSGVVSYPDFLLMQLSADDPLRESIAVIKRSGERASAIVQDLLTLARRNVISKELVQLNEVIATYLESPEHQKMMSYHEKVTISLNLANFLLPLNGSQIHLQKTIMNLLSNGLEAMLAGGKLCICTKNVHLDKPLKGYRDVTTGDYVVLEISDEGIGISEADRGKIFEPFYTKKSMGRSGTGLGMSVVWSTIMDHDGYIDMESSEGCGTTFRLYFPVAYERLESEVRKITIDEYTGNGERLLIVDDLADQREIASAILSKLNYKAHAVDSGEAAIAYLSTHSVDLVILDMIMDPGMDGLDTYQKILERHPGQRAIIASGFSETDRVKRLLQIGAGQYIRKPYTLENIGMAVRKELDATTCNAAQ